MADIRIYGRVCAQDKSVNNCWHLKGGWVRLNSADQTWSANLYGVSAIAETPEGAIKKILNRCSKVLDVFSA